MILLTILSFHQEQIPKGEGIVKLEQRRPGKAQNGLLVTPKLVRIVTTIHGYI